MGRFYNEHVSEITWMRIKSEIVPCASVSACLRLQQNKMLQPMQVQACIFPLQSSLLSDLDRQNRPINTSNTLTTIININNGYIP